MRECLYHPSGIIQNLDSLKKYILLFDKIKIIDDPPHLDPNLFLIFNNLNLSELFEEVIQTRKDLDINCEILSGIKKRTEIEGHISELKKLSPGIIETLNPSKINLKTFDTQSINNINQIHLNLITNNELNTHKQDFNISLCYPFNLLFRIYTGDDVSSFLKNNPKTLINQNDLAINTLLINAILNSIYANQEKILPITDQSITFNIYNSLNLKNAFSESKLSSNIKIKQNIATKFTNYSIPNLSNLSFYDVLELKHKLRHEINSFHDAIENMSRKISSQYDLMECDSIINDEINLGANRNRATSVNQS